MKKLSMAFICLSLLANNANALSLAGKTSENSVFNKSTSVAQFNVGLGGNLGLPLQVSYEKGVTDKIGVGGIVGFASKTTDLIGYKYNYTYIILGARGNYHMQFLENLDTYAGLTLGYNIASVKITPSVGLPVTAGGGIFLAGQVGGRYYFNPKLAASLELGYGIGYANIGLAYKLK
jgi:hypothetical protein